MTDFAAVAEEIYRRAESKFNTGNLAKNIQNLVKNNQPASAAIVEIAENLKIIADGHRADDIFIPQAEKADSAEDIIVVRNTISDLSSDAKERVEAVLSKKEKVIKQERFDKVEKENESKFKSQIAGATTVSEVESILNKAKSQTAGKTYNKINDEANYKLRRIRAEEGRAKARAEAEVAKLRKQEKEKQKEISEKAEAAFEAERKKRANEIRIEAEARKEAERIKYSERQLAEEIARNEQEAERLAEEAAERRAELERQREERQ